MDPLVFVAVLFAAACHAGWNATIKRGLDPLATTVLISIGAAIVAAVFLPIVGLPAAAAWPWCGASVLIHLVYFAALIESYRAGDMGQVYPIARGSAPLLTAIATTAFIGERLGLLGWSGILLLVAGVMLLSLRGGRDLARLDQKAVGFALFTAVTICAYSVVDGVGARHAGNPNSYSAALFVGTGPVMLVYALARRGRCDRRDGTPVEPRPCRRHAAAWLIWHRDLGHDGRSDCHRGGITRNERPLWCGDRRHLSQGAAARGPCGRGVDDRRRFDADPAVLSLCHRRDGGTAIS
jgi:multidrug transporter EmrE-like cation transporter